MKEREKVLFLFDPSFESGLEELYERYEVVVVPLRRGDSLPEEHRDATVVVPPFTMPMGKEEIDFFPNVRLIANYAVGYNNIDVAYAHQKGVAVANTPQSVVRPTAELCVALLLSLSRRVSEWDRLLRSQRSSRKGGMMTRMGVDLNGKTLGIIGYGNIGQCVGKILHDGFGMKMLYNKRIRLSADQEEHLDATYATVDEIFKTADVVSLHTPYNADSHHLVNSERLAMMKPTAMLINVARGAVVDEAALVKALQEGTIAGAGLDVFENDDRPLDALYDLDNVVMTPHVGTQTNDARIAMARELANNVVGFLEGDRPVSLVK
ncbi:MAG: NAD(P)-dependent oxidoreductase [Porphyromonas sp.]|nr:NAD(P)-dependent oxidoreductase [Porphyromonas sp.]